MKQHAETRALSAGLRDGWNMCYFVMSLQLKRAKAAGQLQYCSNITSIGTTRTEGRKSVQRVTESADRASVS